MSFRANAQNHGLRAFWGPLGWREWPIPCVAQQYGMAPITPLARAALSLLCRPTSLGLSPHCTTCGIPPRLASSVWKNRWKPARWVFVGNHYPTPRRILFVLEVGSDFCVERHFFLNADQGDQPDKGCPGESHRPFFSFQRPPPPGFSQIFIFLNPKTSHL